MLCKSCEKADRRLNREQTSIVSAAYYLKNRERILRDKKIEYDLHGSASARRYYRENRRMCIARATAWKKANRQRHNAHNRAWRARQHQRREKKE